MKNADVELYINGTFQEYLKYSKMGAYTSDIYPIQGHIYSIKVFLDDFLTAEASTKIPPPPSVVITDTAFSVEFDLWNANFYSIEVPVDQEYRFMVKAQYTFYNEKYDTASDKLVFRPINDVASIITEDSEVKFTFPLHRDQFFEQTSNTVRYVFLDEKFVVDNKYRYTLRVIDGMAVNYYVESYHVKAYAVDKVFYALVNSLNNYEIAELNPFSQPVAIYSNIKNGTGIFTGINVGKDSVLNPYFDTLYNINMHD